MPFRSPDIFSKSHQMIIFKLHVGPKIAVKSSAGVGNLTHSPVEGNKYSQKTSKAPWITFAIFKAPARDAINGGRAWRRQIVPNSAIIPSGCDEE